MIGPRVLPNINFPSAMIGLALAILMPYTIDHRRRKKWNRTNYA